MGFWTGVEGRFGEGVADNGQSLLRSSIGRSSESKSLPWLLCDSDASASPACPKYPESACDALSCSTLRTIELALSVWECASLSDSGGVHGRLTGSGGELMLSGYLCNVHMPV